MNKGLQNEFGAAGVRSRVPASGIRRQDTLEAADLGRGRSGLVRRFLGHFHGASRLGQIRRDEQGHRQRPPQRATFALVQQERATRLRRRLLGQSLAVHAKIRVIFPHRIFHKIDNKNDNNKIDNIPVSFFFFSCHSLVDEQCYPWKGVYEQCKLQKRTNLEAAGCRAPANPLRKELYKVGPAYRLGNETDIMREILTSGPVQGEYLIFYRIFVTYPIRNSYNVNVSATMKVYQDFFSYESGIYMHTPIAELYESGYHSVRIIGWGEDISTDSGLPIKYWVNIEIYVYYLRIMKRMNHAFLFFQLVVNSWGQEWGENGLFRIRRGINECDIESFVVAVWAKTNV